MAEDTLILIAFVGGIALLILIWMVFSQSTTIKGLRTTIEKRADDQFKAWKDSELEMIAKQQREIATLEARSELNDWKIQYEAEIRKDAIMRSQAVILGKVSEQVAPYHSLFPYNPKDVRFIGSPVDMIVFDGASEKDVRKVVFLEVKTGNSSLTTRQRRIRDAILEGRVEWRELRL